MVAQNKDDREQLYAATRRAVQLLWDNPTERAVFHFAEGLRELETQLFGEGQSVHAVTLYPIDDENVAIDLELVDLYGGDDEDHETANL